jgi:hypothetical protein
MSAPTTAHRTAHPAPEPSATGQPVASTPPDPEPTRPTWTIATTHDLAVTGYLPAWADDDPSTTQVPLGLLHVRLADICHRAVFEGLPLQVRSPPSHGEAGQLAQEQVLWGTIDCTPYAEDPEPRIPVVNLAVIEDYWINHLDPDELTEIATALRIQADRLDHEVRPALIAARTDWTQHHPAPVPR